MKTPHAVLGALSRLISNTTPILAALLLIPSCTVTPDQTQEPTRVANEAASRILKTMEPGSRSSVFPKHANYPSVRPLPASVVQQLPSRVRNLPQNRVMTIAGVVHALGLDAYRDHVSSNFRWNAYYVYLDENHVLFLTCDPISLKERVPSGPITTRWNTVVTEVKLRQNPDRTVAVRSLPAPLY